MTPGPLEKGEAANYYSAQCRMGSAQSSSSLSSGVTHTVALQSETSHISEQIEAQCSAFCRGEGDRGQLEERHTASLDGQWKNLGNGKKYMTLFRRCFGVDHPEGFWGKKVFIHKPSRLSIPFLTLRQGKITQKEMEYNLFFISHPPGTPGRLRQADMTFKCFLSRL